MIKTGDAVQYPFMLCRPIALLLAAVSLSACVGEASGVDPTPLGDDDCAETSCGHGSDNDAHPGDGVAPGDNDAPSDSDPTGPDEDLIIIGPPGPPGCGLDAAAFCETFDQPTSGLGRSGEVDASRWSVSRVAPLPNAGDRNIMLIGPATLPTCRPGLPTSVYPNQDTLVCNPSDDIESNHLLMVVAAQNYGQNSLRSRQPFDFAGRTGKLVFDMQGYATFLGWASVAITEDPTPAPSFAMLGNWEGGSIPKNAVEFQFDDECAAQGTRNHFTLGAVHVFKDYVDYFYPPTVSRDEACPTAAKGRLNRVEVSISETRIEIRVSPVSDDGVTFGEGMLVFARDVDVGFSRGYVHIMAHNHASLKYTSKEHVGEQGEPVPLDAWRVRWDNVGFDGPVLSGWREVEVASSLVPKTLNDLPFMGIGYIAPDIEEGPVSTLTLPGVNITGLTSARLALTAMYTTDYQADSTLWFRFNGGDWRERRFSADELSLFTAGPELIPMTGSPFHTDVHAAIGQMMDVPLGDLVAGDNTLEFTSSNIGQGYPPSVANVDLILTYTP